MSNAICIIEVEFKGLRRGVFTNPQEFPFQLGDRVVVQVDRGMDLGMVSFIGHRPCAEDVEPPEYAVIRKASDNDLIQLEENRHKEKESMNICHTMVDEHQLEMKLVDVEYQFDGRKITFFFTADGRVDFRALVKDLAAHFRSRIDLRQIGARDETRKLSGYGICGRELCCTTWITEFLPITTQMPKDQNLTLNPQKLSGCCGRLKCCLRYELDFYQEIAGKYPPIETRIEGFERKEIGIVEKIDVFKDSLTIRYEDNEFEELSFVQFNSGYDFSPEAPVPQVVPKRRNQTEKNEKDSA